MAWWARIAGDPSAGVDLARAATAAREWHALHPLVEAVLDRITAAARALRDGQDATVAAADLRVLERWSGAGFWDHVRTAAGYEDELETLPALRCLPTDLVVAMALARAPALRRLLAEEVARAVVSDPVVLGSLGLVVDAAPATQDGTAVPSPAGSPEVAVGADAVAAAAELLWGGDQGAALLVASASISHPVHRLGAGPPFVVVVGDAGAGAVACLFGKGAAGGDGDVPLRVHDGDGPIVAGRLYGAGPAGTLEIPGSTVAAVVRGPVDARHALEAAGSAASRMAQPRIRLHPRAPHGAERIAYRWAGATSRRLSAIPSSLRAEAAGVGVDLDLWTAARAG